MGQSSSHGPSRSSPHSANTHSTSRNGSISTNGCNPGVSAKGLLRRASSLTGTPTGKLRAMRSPFSKRRTSKRSGPLSATFTAPNAANVETMDINVATEEQLMTLPGIDRRMAQNIVDYRGRIGGKFQKIDDLALVSGMGATRLDKIRGEICVRRANPQKSSLNGSLSSRTPSIDSVSTMNQTSGDFGTANGGSLPRSVPLNVNTATVFELQQLPGLNQELAAKIVEYRRRKGGFKSVEHLRKVKGLSTRRLQHLNQFLCAHSEDSVSFSSFTSTPLKSSTLLPPPASQGYGGNSAMNSSFLSTADSAPPTPGPLTSGHRKSASVPMRMNYKLVNGGGYRNVPEDDIFELLGAYSHRPVVADDFRYERNGNRALRVASWNLDRMSMAKAENPGVLEVICRTILENKLSIIAVQEVTDVKALARICDELNEPTLKRVAEWRENALQWRFVADENCGRLNGLGFIYDNHECRFLAKLSQSIELAGQGEAAVKASERDASSYLGVFQLDDWTLTVLNVYLRYFDLARMGGVVEQMRSSLQDAPIDFEHVYLVAGDFTGLTEGASELEGLANGAQNGGRAKAGGEKEEEQRQLNAGADETDEGAPSSGGRRRITVDDIFNDFQFDQVFEANVTSFVDLAHVQDIDDGLNVSHAPPKNIKKSSCNVLCRDKLPSVTDPFLEAVYRTKSPFDLPRVPSVKDPAAQNGRLTGHAGVVREGLCHMAIPREWTWGGPASDHCPVWIECYKRLKKDPPANGTSTGRAPAPAVLRLADAIDGVMLLGRDGDGDVPLLANGQKSHSLGRRKKGKRPAGRGAEEATVQ